MKQTSNWAMKSGTLNLSKRWNEAYDGMNKY